MEQVCDQVCEQVCLGSQWVGVLAGQFRILQSFEYYFVSV